MKNMKNKKCICGTVTVGERGQIVIPKKARDYFNFQANEELIVLADSDLGITIIKAGNLKAVIEKLKFYDEEYNLNKGE